MDLGPTGTDKAYIGSLSIVLQYVQKSQIVFLNSCSKVTNHLQLGKFNFFIATLKHIKGMKMKLIALIFATALSTSAIAASTYEVEAINNMEDKLVINSEVFEAKTYCYGFEEGDKVIFIEGDANAVCTSAKIFNTRNENTCSLWCP